MADNNQMEPQELLEMLTHRVVVRYLEDLTCSTGDRRTSGVDIWAATIHNGSLVTAKYSGSDQCREMSLGESKFDRTTVWATPMLLEGCAQLLAEWAKENSHLVSRKPQIAWVQRRYDYNEVPMCNLMVLLNLEWFRAMLKHCPQVQFKNSEDLEAFRVLRERFNAFRNEYLNEAIRTVSMT